MTAVEHAAYNRRWYVANRSRILAQRRAHPEASRRSCRRYQARHKKLLRARAKAYYAAHRERRSEYARSYRQNNRAKHAEASRRWEQAHRRQRTEYQRRRRLQNYQQSLADARRWYRRHREAVIAKRHANPQAHRCSQKRSYDRHRAIRIDRMFLRRNRGLPAGIVEMRRLLLTFRRWCQEHHVRLSEVA